MFFFALGRTRAKSLRATPAAAAKRLARETVPVTLATMRRCYPHAIGKGRSNPRSINPRKWLDTVAASAAPAPPKPAVGAVSAVLPNPSRAFRSAKYSVGTKTHRLYRSSRNGWIVLIPAPKQSRFPGPAQCDIVHGRLLILPRSTSEPRAHADLTDWRSGHGSRSCPCSCAGNHRAAWRLFDRAC